MGNRNAKDARKVVICFGDGNVAVCVGGKQVPELQKPWVTEIANRLEAAGYDPTEFEVCLPRAVGNARFFRVPNGWNLRFDE